MGAVHPRKICSSGNRIYPLWGIVGICSMETQDSLCLRSRSSTVVSFRIGLRDSAVDGIFHHVGSHDVFSSLVHEYNWRHDVRPHLLQCPGLLGKEAGREYKLFRTEGWTAWPWIKHWTQFLPKWRRASWRRRASKICSRRKGSCPGWSNPMLPVHFVMNKFNECQIDMVHGICQSCLFDSIRFALNYVGIPRCIREG